MEDIALVIGHNLARYRKDAGITQAELAEHAGLSTAFVSRVERGQKMMKVQTLCDMADALNVSCDALLRKESRSARLENIAKLLENQPDEFLHGIEQLIRSCVANFSPK